jgi:hypothetical protein
MDKRRCFLLIAVAAGALLWSVRPVAAEDLSGLIHAAGDVIVSLAGFPFDAELTGTIALDGEIRLEAEAIPFITQGEFIGFGAWNPLRFVGEAWAAFRARSEDDLEIRGLLYATSASSAPLRAGETVAGRHHLVVCDGPTRMTVEGSFRGALRGSPVPPQAPLTLLFRGTGAFTMDGHATAQTASTALPRDIPLDGDRFPDSFRQTLQALFGWTPLDLGANTDVKRP